MKWRVIVRLSYENDTGSKLRNQIVPALESAGLANSRTGIWEGAAVSPTDAAKHLGDVLIALAVASDLFDGSNVDLDHIWVYIDKATV